MMYQDSSVSFKGLSDGETNTILIGESLFGFWNDAQSSCARIADDWNNDELPPNGSPPNASQTPEPPPNPIEPDDIPDRGSNFDNYIKTSRNHVFDYGSWHLDSVHFAFCDGRARPLSKTMDFKILKALVTRAGRERIDDY